MTDVLVDVDIEMVELVLAEIRAAERQLQGEAVQNIELLPQRNLNNQNNTLAAPSLSFCTWNEQSLKLNTAQLFFISMENTCSFFDGSLPEHPSTLYITIITHEYILFAIVPMDVTAEGDLALLFGFLDQLWGE